jgi:NADH-quinone oxidoreductase subunit M
MDKFPILSALLLIPLFGGLVIFFISDSEKNVAFRIRLSAVLTVVLTFILSIFAFINFDANNPNFQMIESNSFLGGMGIDYKVGVDGIAMPMLMLTTFVLLIAVIASLNRISERLKLYYGALLVMEFFILGAFISLNVIMFYIFFESILIPMFFLIGVWGGKNKTYAMYKFFIYTFFASILMLAVFLFIGSKIGSFDYEVWRTINLCTISGCYSEVFWWMLLISFAVKIPMFPLHTWLPDAHVEAPASVSMILAGVLLKLGGFSMIRFHLGCFSEISVKYFDVIAVFSIIAMIYGSLLAWVQTDMKKLVAYSSLAHMSYVTLGIYSLNPIGVSGAIIQMISHGIISAGLFYMVDILYSRTHSRLISKYSGVANQMPWLAVTSFVLLLGVLGFPLTSGFVGELMVTISVFYKSVVFGVFVALGLVLAPIYGLFLYKKIFWGTAEGITLRLKPLSVMESVVGGIFALLVLWIGIAPNIVTNLINSSVENILSIKQGGAL